MAAPKSCTSQSVFCCILHNFASGGNSVDPPTDHGTMSRLMFGLTKAARPPRKMRQRMRQKCVCVVLPKALQSKEHYCTQCIDTHTCGSNVVWKVEYKWQLEWLNSQLLLYYAMCFVGKVCSATWQRGLLGGLIHERVNPGLKLG